MSLAIVRDALAVAIEHDMRIKQLVARRFDHRCGNGDVISTSESGQSRARRPIIWFGKSAQIEIAGRRDVAGDRALRKQEQVSVRRTVNQSVDISEPLVDRAKPVRQLQGDDNGC